MVGARNRPTTMPNALTFAAVYDFGIKDPNFVLGPKIPRPTSITRSFWTACRSASPARRRRRKPQAIEKTDDLNDA